MNDFVLVNPAATRQREMLEEADRRRLGHSAARARTRHPRLGRGSIGPGPRILRWGVGLAEGTPIDGVERETRPPRLTG